MLSALRAASLRIGTFWNSRRRLERAKRPGTARRALGTRLGAWTARKALAALVLFVGRRYYLRPISAPGPPEGLLEQPRASGLLFSALGPPAGLIAATRARVCDGNAMSV